MAKKITLCDKARKLPYLESRIVARMDDLGRDLTDQETISEVRHHLEDLPYKGMFDLTEPEELREYKRVERAWENFLKKAKEDVK